MNEFKENAHVCGYEVQPPPLCICIDLKCRRNFHEILCGFNPIGGYVKFIAFKIIKIMGIQELLRGEKH